ncbi:sensor histidine kinase [Limibacter armeniacum]|uniref:sensor histidine kinase n=1 Tax=Limibacter armeniacum TaxID=466084 RepID=UPI002FE65B2A
MDTRAIHNIPSRLSAEKIQLLTTHTHSAYWEYDFTTEKIAFSSNLFTMIGQPEVQGYTPIRKFKKVIEKESSERLLYFLHMLKKGDHTAFSMRFNCLYGNGELINFEMKAHRLNTKQVFGTLLLISKAGDATEKQTESAIESERKRIGRELHDHLGQYLTAISIALDKLTIENDQLTEKSLPALYKSQQLIKDSINVCRELSHQLTAENQLPLATELQRIAAIPENIFDGEITFHHNIEGMVFSDILTHNICNIVQESINNCLKHAQATQITIQLINHKAENLITLTIEDNGLGFQTTPNSPVTQGIGLSNIKQYTGQLGGICDIESASQKGTAIIIQIPLSPNEPQLISSYGKN